MIAKRDVESAYKLCWLCVDDEGLFATELPGDFVNLGFSVLAVYLVLTFGWGGSPGNYMAFAMGSEMLFESRAPAWKQWHDEVPYHSKALMGDKVLVEPNVGIRPAMSGKWAEESLRKIFGLIAINETKLAEEGTFAVQQLVSSITLKGEPCIIRK